MKKTDKMKYTLLWVYVCLSRLPEILQLNVKTPLPSLFPVWPGALREDCPLKRKNYRTHPNPITSLCCSFPLLIATAICLCCCVAGPRAAPGVP